MAESRSNDQERVAHFAERLDITRAEAGEFFEEVLQLTEQELLRYGGFV